MDRAKNIVTPTEARKNFSTFLDSTMHQPISVKRREETFISFSLKQLAESLPFNLVVNKEDKEPFLYFSEIPEVIGHGRDMDAAILDLAEGLLDYASIYMNDFDAHYNAPNLKNQMPQVSVLKDMNVNEIGGFVRAKLER